MYFGDGVMEDGRDRWAVMVDGAIADWLDSKRINRVPRKLTSPQQFAVTHPLNHLHLSRYVATILFYVFYPWSGTSGLSPTHPG